MTNRLQEICGFLIALAAMIIAAMPMLAPGDIAVSLSRAFGFLAALALTTYSTVTMLVLKTALRQDAIDDHVKYRRDAGQRSVVFRGFVAIVIPCLYWAAGMPFIAGFIFGGAIGAMTVNDHLDKLHKAQRSGRR